jgi:hypothetical protein
VERGTTQLASDLNNSLSGAELWLPLDFQQQQQCGADLAIRPALFRFSLRVSTFLAHLAARDHVGQLCARTAKNVHMVSAGFGEDEG